MPQMLECQREKFYMDTGQIYLNGAYMSPLLRTAEVAGIIGLRMKRQPSQIIESDFFNKLSIARTLFALIIGASNNENCVVVPSTSYALSNAIRNIPLDKQQKVVIVDQIFPSNYYSWSKRAKEVGAIIEIVKPSTNTSESWSTTVLNAIDDLTQVVNISHVHWSDGSIFDLKAIAEKVHAHGGYLIVDGTQSIGALPFDLTEIGADVVFASSYKWMLGPYSIGMAYYNDRFQNGQPVEESWLNRKGSDNFTNLVDYQDEYRSGALRFEVGESPNFVLLPIMIAGMEQLVEWSPLRIQEYCKSIVSDALHCLRNVGYRISNHEMAYHLFGIRLPESMDMETVKSKLSAANISVSYRGDAIRVSPNVYNDESELQTLVDVLVDLAK